MGKGKSQNAEHTKAYADCSQVLTSCTYVLFDHLTTDTRANANCLR